jgi:hypothetical protein
VESGIAQGSQSRPEHQTGLRVGNSNQDGWRLICARRWNEEIKEPGICHSVPEPERFPQDVEAGTQILERKTSNVANADIDKSCLRNNL